MDFKKICYNCMREKSEEGGKCPHCGFVNVDYKYPENQLPPMTPLNGKYLIGRALGAGGFGITYIALDLHLQVVVAIKELYLKKVFTREKTTTVSYRKNDKECFEDNKKRFLQEARVLALFNENDNEGVVKVKEHFEENNTAYIVMEYLNGSTLKQYVSKNKLSIEETVKLMKPICHSLAKIHQFGVVHMDVSPDNIMILPDGRAKLLDFGGSKSLDDKEIVDFVAFKRGYAPPEQCVGNGKIGSWTDIYAVAATIYYCITGEKPVDSMERSAGAELIRPSKLGVKISKKVENALMRALELEHHERTQTMEEFWKKIDISDNRSKFVKMVIAGGLIVLSILVLLFGLIFNKANDYYVSETGDSINEQEIETIVPEEGVKYEIGDIIPVVKGAYIFENASNREYIMGIDSGLGDNGANLKLKYYEEDNSNRIAITDEVVDDGFYNLRVVHTNSIIQTFDSQELGTPVAQYQDMYDMGTQKWVFIYCGHDDATNMDLVILRNAAGTVLAPSEGVISDGNNIVLAQENMEDDSQKWYMRWSEKDYSQEDVAVLHEGDMISNLSGVYSLTSALDGISMMSLSRNEFFAEPTAIVWENVWDNTQKFEFALQEELRYKIYPVDQLEGEKKCLEYDEFTDTVVLREDSENVNQLFRIVYTGGNRYLIQCYNEKIIGFELGENESTNGRAICAKAYEEYEDSRFEKWIINASAEE